MHSLSFASTPPFSLVTIFFLIFLHCYENWYWVSNILHQCSFYHWAASLAFSLILKWRLYTFVSLIVSSLSYSLMYLLPLSKITSPHKHTPDLLYFSFIICYWIVESMWNTLSRYSWSISVTLSVVISKICDFLFERRTILIWSDHLHYLNELRSLNQAEHKHIYKIKT